jgi:hypothetical protein
MTFQETRKERERIAKSTNGLGVVGRIRKSLLL